MPLSNVIVHEDVLDNTTAEAILSHIAANPKITYAKLADKMSLSSKTIQRNVEKLKNAGRLKRIGSGRGGYWEV